MKNQYPDIKIKNINSDNLQRDILYWGSNFNQLSFEEFYKDNKKVTGRMLVAPTDVRLLLKTNPKKINSSDIDFSKIL
jgi:hypothetical protein